MHKAGIGLLLTCLFLASPALADYTLVCQSGGATREVAIRSAGSFNDACRIVNTDAAYSQYTNCIDGKGRSGACPPKNAAQKTFTLTVVTRDRKDRSQRELGGRVHVGNPPGYGQFLGAPATFKVEAGEVTVYAETPTKDAACNYVPEMGEASRGVYTVNVSKDMTFVVYFECKRP